MTLSLTSLLRQSCHNCMITSNSQMSIKLIPNISNCRLLSLHTICKHYHSPSYVNPSFITSPSTFNKCIHATPVSRKIYQHSKRISYINFNLLQFSDGSRTFNRYKSTNNVPKDAFGKKSVTSSNSNVILDRYIYVKTLDSLYEDVTNGIILDTAYGDSRPNEDFDPSVPVVLALHDTPGSHKDVVPLLSFFAKLGCRTICPTFPGHDDTRGIMRNFDDIFSQLTMERATFVHDFLGDLGIKRVDMVIGVGASSYTAMALCTRQSEVYRSMALISPWPLNQPRFEMNNKIMKHIHDLWEMVYLRPVARLLLPAFKIGNAVTVNEKVAACYLVQNLDFGEADGFAITASIQNVPCLAAYGAKDELVNEELYEDLVSKLGITSHQVITDHQKGVNEDEASQQRSLVFPDSGYDILTKHQGILCAHILRLLQQFHPTLKL